MSAAGEEKPKEQTTSKARAAAKSPNESSTSSARPIKHEVTPPDSQERQSKEQAFPSWILLFLALCIFRMLNTLLIQSYFDPDEFWQTMEPAYCEVFVEERPCAGYTWEWTRRAPDSAANLVEQSMLGPARTYLSVLPTYAFFWIVKKLGMDSYWVVSRGPVLLTAVTVAAPIDMAVWYAASWLKPPKEGARRQWIIPAWCLFCSLTSWFNAYSLVRTFANGQETLFLILACALVSPELIGNVNAPHSFLRACFAFLLGGLSVAIRFTSIAAFVPMGILLALRYPSVSSRVGYLFIPCALFGLLGLGVAMVVDHEFFGFWTIPFLANFHFNVVLDFASLYGSHPFHWYISAGIPAIAGLLLPFVLLDLWKFVLGSDVSYGQRNLWIIVLSYLFTMSFNAHKEFRYIHPVLPFLCLLAGRHVRAFFIDVSGGRPRLRMAVFGYSFIAANVLAVLYLGLFHQRGPIEVNRRIVATARALDGSRTNCTFSIHYLTGACHSTPLHSHLHSPPLKFETWALDCSPDCRSNPDLVCEFEEFARDPVRFVGESFFPCSGEVDRSTCLVESQPRQAPDFLVTLSSYADRIEHQLDMLGLHEIARFPHHINGATIGGVEFGPDPTNKIFRRLALSDWLDVSMEEMILYSAF